jgi:hypothetical protein
MGKVLSIDLACKRLEDIGVCVRHQACGRVKAVDFPAARDDPGVQDPPAHEQCAQAIYDYCARREIAVVLLDGPQGWRHADSELKDKRHCDKLLNTQAKVGREGQVKPRNFKRFVEFSIAVFDELTQRGAELVKNPFVQVPDDRLLAAESFPRSAWKKLGIRPLPGKKKTTPGEETRCLETLQQLFGFQAPRRPAHDELCALVAGFAGVAILAGNGNGYIAEGTPPKKVGRIWVEGFIVNPRLDPKPVWYFYSLPTA